MLSSASVEATRIPSGLMLGRTPVVRGAVRQRLRPPTNQSLITVFMFGFI